MRRTADMMEKGVWPVWLLNYCNGGGSILAIAVGIYRAYEALLF